MLWSDPPDEPPEELRDVQAKLRRMGIVLAVVAVVMMLLLPGR
ncbi:morphogenic membrane protein MmpB [Streptomyces angustmyceticus]